MIGFPKLHHTKVQSSAPDNIFHAVGLITRTGLYSVLTCLLRTCEGVRFFLKKRKTRTFDISTYKCNALTFLIVICSFCVFECIEIQLVLAFRLYFCWK